jgi:transcriptional repressor of dcmA and dcmR
MRDSSSGWLSTRQTAARLGISEASVRRWGDQGTLRVRRVGKRGERRFKAEHVERFVVERPPPPSDEASSVVLGGHQVAFGSHLCAFYDSDAGRLRLSVPFLAEGLRSGQPCFLFAKGRVLDRYLASLRVSPGVDVRRALRNGALVVADGPGTTTRAALDYLESTLWSALDRNASFVRGVGEMVSEREQFTSEREMLTYESMLNATIKRFPCVVICQYDVRQFSGQAVFEAMRAHPDVLAAPGRFFLK